MLVSNSRAPRDCLVMIDSIDYAIPLSPDVPLASLVDRWRGGSKIYLYS